MENMKKVLFLLLFLLVLGVAGTNAQVRIGGDGEPHTAAVLDLNVDNSDDGNNGGLALPRVELINNTTLLNGATPTKGTLVYNTKADMADGQGTGTYYWNGSVWMVVAGEVGAPGPNAVGEVASYRTWCFPAYTNLGCWMIENSKEGTSSGTTYQDQRAGAYGYYYNDDQKNGACAPIAGGYGIPTDAQWNALRNYINSSRSSVIEKLDWTMGKSLAGCYRISWTTWQNWGTDGYWWTSSSGRRIGSTGGVLGTIATDAAFWFSVRCVKS